MNPILQDNRNSMIQKFNQFKKTITGDPEQMVKELLNSGQMSQEQFEELKQQAQLFSSFLR